MADDNALITDAGTLVGTITVFGTFLPSPYEITDENVDQFRTGEVVANVVTLIIALYISLRRESVVPLVSTLILNLLILAGYETIYRNEVLA